MCLSLCLPIATRISETTDAIAMRCVIVTDSVRRMHQVLIELTLTFIQTHKDLNHENKIMKIKNNNCSIILENVQAMPIKFPVKIVQLQVYIIFSQSNDFDCHSRSQL